MTGYRRSVGGMTRFKSQPRKNYGGVLRVGEQNVACYTRKQLKSLHPAGDYKIIAEYAPAGKTDQVGILESGQDLPLFGYKTHNRFLYREKGYVAVEDGEDRYVCLLQKVLPQRIALAAVCLVLIAGGIFWAANWSKPVTTVGENTVPAAAAPNLDTNATDWQGAQPTNSGGVTQGISIPGFKSITIAADTADVKVNFSNPEGNPCYFEISLKLNDGTVLYKSKMIKPGQGIYSIKLSQPLSAGTYDAAVQYDTFNLNGLAPMNGATVNIKLIAQ